MAQRFDEASLQLVGDPFAVVSRVSFALTRPQLAASASPDGTLVYYTGRSGESQLTWFDRTGKAVGTVGPQAAQWGVSLAPDGNKVAITRRAPNDTEAAWVHDLVSGGATRLTPPGSPGGGGLWSRDSRTIWFGMTTREGPARYQRDFASGQLERFKESTRLRALRRPFGGRPFCDLYGHRSANPLGYLVCPGRIRKD